MRLGVKMMAWVRCAPDPVPGARRHPVTCPVPSDHDSPHDHSVRDYNNRIIQFQYNRTGLDPKWQVNVPEYGQQFADMDSVLSTWACQNGLHE